MTLVIEIPEAVKQAFDKATEEDIYGCYYDYNSIIGRAIKNGVPIEDAISRQAVLNTLDKMDDALDEDRTVETYKMLLIECVSVLPSVTPKQKMGRCKDCKYFEYDSVAKVDGIPLIVAHEICSKWGGGCKTKEDGYCFLYEPQESE